MTTRPGPVSFVVTGGGCGIGRAIVERLLSEGDTVALIALEPGALAQPLTLQLRRA